MGRGLAQVHHRGYQQRKHGGKGHQQVTHIHVHRRRVVSDLPGGIAPHHRKRDHPRAEKAFLQLFGAGYRPPVHRYDEVTAPEARPESAAYDLHLRHQQTLVRGHHAHVQLAELAHPLHGPQKPSDDGHKAYSQKQQGARRMGRKGLYRHLGHGERRGVGSPVHGFELYPIFWTMPSAERNLERGLTRQWLPASSPPASGNRPR
ncbi:hypothetical protein HRbin09_01474 [bacterium HR09]|nr:hypothetical protein HRbin09_01474 [bacterium HR09]